MRAPYDLTHAADELAELAGLGAAIERGVFADPVGVTRTRTRAAIALAAAAEATRDAGYSEWLTLARFGELTLAGMRSPEQLAACAAWCRALAVSAAAVGSRSQAVAA